MIAQTSNSEIFFPRFLFHSFFLNLEQNLKRDLLKHFKAGRKIVYRSREYWLMEPVKIAMLHARPRWLTCGTKSLDPGQAGDNHSVMLTS